MMPRSRSVTDARCTLARRHGSPAERMRNNAHRHFLFHRLWITITSSARQTIVCWNYFRPPSAPCSHTGPDHPAPLHRLLVLQRDRPEMPGLCDDFVGCGRDLRHSAARTDTLWQLSSAQWRSLIRRIVCQLNNDHINPRVYDVAGNKLSAIQVTKFYRVNSIICHLANLSILNL